MEHLLLDSQRLQVVKELLIFHPDAENNKRSWRNMKRFIEKILYDVPFEKEKWDALFVKWEENSKKKEEKTNKKSKKWRASRSSCSQGRPT